MSATPNRGPEGHLATWEDLERTPEVVLAAHDVVVPDLAGWRRSRLPALPSRRFDIVPDCVCEVLSPASARHDRIVKANLYLRAGLPYFWLIAPPERTLEAWASREGTWVRVGAFTDGDVVRIPPFDAVEIDVGSLFAPRADSPQEPGQP